MARSHPVIGQEYQFNGDDYESIVPVGVVTDDSGHITVHAYPDESDDFVRLTAEPEFFGTDRVTERKRNA